MITVKELIELLQKENPDAIVTYAYNEYGNNGLHDQITNDNIIAIGKDGNPIEYASDLVIMESNLKEDEYWDEYPMVSDKYDWVPCIKLFSN